MDLLNKNWKEYLKKGEKPIVHTKPDNKAILINLILQIILIGVIYFTVLKFIRFSTPGKDELKINTFILNIISTVVLIGIIWRFFLYKSTHYVVVNGGVYNIRGIFLKTIGFIPYKKITDLKLKRGLLEQLIYNTGTINLNTAGNVANPRKFNNYESTLSYLKDYKKVKDAIENKLD